MIAFGSDLQRTASAKSLRTPASRPTRPTKLELRAERIQALKIEYIDNPAFAAEPVESPASAFAGRTALPSGSGPIVRLCSSPLLEPAEEAALFQRMNHLKHEADRLRRKLKRSPDVKLLDRIDRLLAEATAIRDRIVSANLRLVVSIAKKFVGSAGTLEELVSDGSVTLVRAVEKFDFSRGNRFSTYATYAVQRGLYRLLLRSRKQQIRYVYDEQAIATVESLPESPGLSLSQFRQLEQSLASLLDQLSGRERTVLVARFGLDGSKPRTFRALGEELGVCKERIRQLQYRAIEKLREIGGPQLAAFADC